MSSGVITNLKTSRRFSRLQKRYDLTATIAHQYMLEYYDTPVYKGDIYYKNMETFMLTHNQTLLFFIEYKREGKTFEEIVDHVYDTFQSNLQQTHKVGNQMNTKVHPESLVESKHLTNKETFELFWQSLTKEQQVQETYNMHKGYYQQPNTRCSLYCYEGIYYRFLSLVVEVTKVKTNRLLTYLAKGYTLDIAVEMAKKDTVIIALHETIKPSTFIKRYAVERGFCLTSLMYLTKTLKMDINHASKLLQEEKEARQMGCVLHKGVLYATLEVFLGEELSDNKTLHEMYNEGFSSLYIAWFIENRLNTSKQQEVVTSNT